MPETSAAEPPDPPSRHRLRRWAIGVGGVLVLLVVAIAVAASWHYSSELLVPDRSPVYDLEVLEVAPGRVVLQRNENSSRPGIYGLAWDGGHAIVGRVLKSDDDTVTRTLRRVEGRLSKGVETELEANVYSADPRRALGIPFTRPTVQGQLGPLPQWQVGAGEGTWAIFVHGINSSRESGVRLIPALRRAGLPTLLVSYRNDPDAPPTLDGLYHLGQTEWHDVQAAARYALAQGAQRLVLIGYSMGGALVTQFMEYSDLADRVRGLVLDAPALSWKPILSFGADERGLPSFASTPVEWLAAARAGLDWDRLDALRHTDDLRLPILLFHGTEDDTVPISTSDEFARELPREVTYYRVPRAGHVESWNVDPSLYERRLHGFLKRIGALGTSRSQPSDGSR